MMFFVYEIRYVIRKAVFGVSTRSNTNWAVEPQKIARGLQFWILEVKRLYYLFSENEGVDQLCGLRLWFCICKNRFAHGAVH